MKQMIIIIILMLILIGGFLFGGSIVLNPNASSRSISPFYSTTTPLKVKNIDVPIGTKLIYDAYFFKDGEQDEILREDKLRSIEFPLKAPISWGGVLVTSIS